MRGVESPVFLHGSRHSFCTSPEKFKLYGSGSRELFEDAELQSAGAQLTTLEPQSELDYCFLLESSIVYILPRSDCIVIARTPISVTRRPVWILQPKRACSTPTEP
jgi:hypothetical protein